jgi:hypothetical protein
MFYNSVEEFSSKPEMETQGKNSLLNRKSCFPERKVMFSPKPEVAKPFPEIKKTLSVAESHVFPEPEVVKLFPEPEVVTHRFDGRPIRRTRFRRW